MQLIEHHLLFVVVTFIVGTVPYKVHIHNKSGKKGKYTLKLTASLWQFTYTKQDWYLRIVGIQLLSRRIRDDLDK